MELSLYSFDGKATGRSIQLPEAIFARPVHTGLVHRLLVLQLANARLNYAHVKTRGEVAGSTRKIYKQKGTGQARAGDSRSSTRRGGGKAFGPRNTRNFTLAMNKQERRIALFSLLSSKAADNKILVVEGTNQNVVKTQDIVKLFAGLGKEKALFALNASEKNLMKGARNLQYIRPLQVNYLNPRDIMKYDTLVLSEAALKELSVIYKI
jgi:large subunit ribosomal protein L4